MTKIEIVTIIIGWIGNIVIISINIPQAYKTIRTRSTKDISLLSNILLAFVLLDLFVYGILIHQYPIIIGNIISFFIMLPILILKATEKRRESKKEREKFDES